MKQKRVPGRISRFNRFNEIPFAVQLARAKKNERLWVILILDQCYKKSVETV